MLRPMADSCVAALFGFFLEVWTVDFEYSSGPGERPRPVCLVAHEMKTGKRVRLWEDELAARSEPPYATGETSVVIAYNAAAEMGCHLALGWQQPKNILDLYVEYKNLRNGLPTPCGHGLLGALTDFGLDGIAAAEKESMRQLALRGGPWSPDERRELLDYCESDVDGLDRLLPVMLPHIDLPRALLRGSYMRAVAEMEHRGVPIDTETLGLLHAKWSSLRHGIIGRIDETYGVYDGTTFKRERFEAWLRDRRIPWPQLPSGALALDDETFRTQAMTYPAVAPLRELRQALSEMRLEDLAVGADGRNRTPLWAYGTKTSRNAPSNSKFIFGAAAWLRHLVMPVTAHALAYVDFGQQEFGIAGALSGDLAMQDAYVSGDPYLAFAKQAGACPADATPSTHRDVREQFKACALGVQYGMGAETLAQRIGRPTIVARDLLALHRRTYPRFWAWSQAAVDHAMVHGFLPTVFGWSVKVDAATRPTMLANFPMQANGAEMLRLACRLALERGASVCAPVHDALLIEAPIAEIDEAVRTTQDAMSDASAVVLDGFRLRSDVKIVRAPERFRSERGAGMWRTVMDLLGERP